MKGPVAFGAIAKLARAKMIVREVKRRLVAVSVPAVEQVLPSMRTAATILLHFVARPVILTG